MSYGNSIDTSLYGRRFGLTRLSSGAHGAATVASKGGDLLYGPEDLRRGVTTAEATGTDIPAWGVSFLPGTSAASSSVYILEPPIPGVQKTVVFTSGTTPQYLKTKNAETFRTSADSTVATVIRSTLTGACIHLIGLTTAIWGLYLNGSTTITPAATT